MKNTLLVAAVFAAGISQASLEPTWISDHGSVYAKWDQWAAYSAGSSSAADYFEAIDYNGTDVSGSITAADVYSDYAFNDFDGEGYSWLELGATDDLSFWMPSFSGHTTQETVIQLTYWNNLDDSDWRADFDLSVSLYDESGDDSYIAGGLSYLGEEYDTETGLITEAWGFTAVNSADGFFADFTYDETSLTDPGIFVESVTIDTISYEAIPEPAAAVSMLFGGVILTMVRRRIKK